MRKMMMLLALLTFVLVLQSEVMAQLYLGPRAGYYKSKDADQGQMYGGLAARLAMGGLKIEGAIDYRQEKYDDGMMTLRSWPVQVSALLYPLPVVYGLAGAGWYHTTVDYDQNKIGLGAPEDQTTSTLGYHLGAGLELPVSNMKLTADVRYVFLNYDLDNIGNKEQPDSDFLAITLGLLWEL
ncbi:MAG TPA: outer membrane beta-barrel protein [bacterium]|nr:outer membrane beta-barrel protein [bacterium]HQG46853.1 outer membrane beta-barrel protein [bacterium]HQJ65288.1 outer membrane beta-barrel protein [bacterium]